MKIFPRKEFTISIVVLGFIVLWAFFGKNLSTSFPKQDTLDNPSGLKEEPHPLSIEYMRSQLDNWTGSDLVIEETLSSGSNYSRYITSYKSDDFKIYALLTIPQGNPPAGGWPVIIFNHGYIPPAQYQTEERYNAYTDVFSREGFIVLKPDYRGHGNSEGNPEGAYYSPAYTIDVLNAVSSVKRFKDADSNRIGMWGHSMGGSITLQSMVVTKDIKVGVIWAGVVASYEDMAKNWSRGRPWVPSQREQAFRRPGRQALIDKYGDFDKNPDFWNSISPISYVRDISGPIQLHHGTADDDVPILFSERLNEALQNAGKEVEFYSYPDADHNISGASFNLAMQRSLEFFNRYLK